MSGVFWETLGTVTSPRPSRITLGRMDCRQAMRSRLTVSLLIWSSGE